MKKYGLLYTFCLISMISSAQWTSINPGAGGQVQDIVCDPNVKDRLYLASDMEGIYMSENNGLSWHPKGELLHNRVYAVAIAPDNSDKLYVGTLYGLEVSRDGGHTFDFVELTRKKSIGVISVHPQNTNIVLAGLGWRDDLDFIEGHFGLDRNGKGEIFRSTDGGQTWQSVFFDLDVTSNRNVLTIQFDPTDPNRVYIGTNKGVFVSSDAGENWKKIKPPKKSSSNWGVTVSPDGKVLYAAYAIKGRQGHIYATATDSIQWVQVTAGSGVQIGKLDYWYPEIDPRSKGEQHKLIVGLQYSRDGLFEGTFTWSNNTLIDYSWNTIWSGVGGFDTGWDNAHPNPRFVHYTPTNWDRAIWSTTNQTIFQGVPQGHIYNWNNRYSIPNYNFQVPHWDTFWPTYSSRGTESTYTYDVAMSDNYIIQGQADNGLVESWDYGRSWSNVQHRNSNMNLSDVQAVDIARTKSGTEIVLAQATGGYGGNAIDGRLYVKVLESKSPKDQWNFLAGGPEFKGGLANGVLRDIAVSPVNSQKVFMFSAGQGLFMIEDIEQVINQDNLDGNVFCRKISNGVLDEVVTVKKIAPHPTDENIVYLNGAKGNQGVFKGVKKNDGWHWTKIYRGSGWDAEVIAWQHKEQVYLLFAGQSQEKGNDGNNYIAALSLDEGKSWQTIFTKKQALNLRQNSWFKSIKDDFRFHSKGGIVGFENQIIINFYDHRMQKAYGIFKGVIQKNNKVKWQDFTGDIAYGGLTSAIVVPIKGVNHVVVSTAGAGAWIRPLDE